MSGDEHDFLLVLLAGSEELVAVARSVLELDVLELHLHHEAGVKLQRDDARVERRMAVSSSSHSAVTTPLIRCSM